MNRRTCLKTIVLSSGAVLFGPQALVSAFADSKSIKILMIYNNYGDSPEFLCEWGVSVWIEDRDTAIMFDTGQTPEKLWNNMQKLNIDIQKLSKIIISHNHPDHTGGLGLILEKTNHVPAIFVPRDELNNFQTHHPKANITGVSDPVRINQNTWTTGSLEGFRHEQAVILVQENSMIVMTGCAHPGIIEIVQKAKSIHADKQLRLVMGGFHMHNFSEAVVADKSDRLKELGVKKIAPSHCTGTTSINVLKERWQENFIDFGAGDNIMIGSI